jgi:hypothetical protein
VEENRFANLFFQERTELQMVPIKEILFPPDFGEPDLEIVRLAQQEYADLIVIDIRG